MQTTARLVARMNLFQHQPVGKGLLSGPVAICRFKGGFNNYATLLCSH